MRELRRVKQKENQVDYIVVDIETKKDDLEGNPLLGEPNYISWCIDGEGFGKASDNLTAWMVSYFLQAEYSGWILYAHNGFRFDFFRVNWEWLAHLGYTAEYLTGKDGSIKSVSIQLGDYHWIIRDTVLLVPMPLSKLSEAFSPEHLKIKRKQTFSEKEFDPFDSEDVEYAIQDSIALWHGIAKVDKLLQENFGVSIHDSPTLPGLSYRAFRQTIEEGEQYSGIGYGVSHAARDSYHGGQTIAFQTGLFEDVVSLDANSMYPYIMITYPLPTGKVSRHNLLPSHAHPELTLCLAIAFIPDGVFPLLKSKNEEGQTGNFNGVVTGWFWLFELEKQRELGGRFDVLECYIWEDSTDVCSRFVSKTRDLRMQDYYGPVGMISKQLGNNLYGKFAQSVGEWSLVLSVNEPEDGYPAYDPRFKKTDGLLWNVPAKPSYQPDMTHWASYITAKARILLNEGIQRAGYDKVLYCDTDSIFIPRSILNSFTSIMGKEYGQFKVEKEVEYFRAIAPKAYVMVKSEEIVVKNKGIPSYSIMESKRVDETIEYIQSNNLIQILKKGKGYGRKATRKLAKETSTTNGMIVNESWVPSKCEPRKLEELKFDKPSLLLQKIYAIVMVEYQNFGG